jgi:hypothetical protein
MDHSGEPSPRVVQIAGFDPLMMADAARRNVDAGAEIIDINMGCPAKKVCNRLAGSALLQDEALVARILHAVGERRAGAGHAEDAHRLGSEATRTAFASRRSPKIAAFKRSRFTAARVRTCIRELPSTKPWRRSSRKLRSPYLQTATSTRRSGCARF